MKKLKMSACLLASVCLALGTLVSAPKAIAADETGYSAKTYVPDATDYVNYYGGVGNLDEQDGGGVFTFAHGGFTVPMEGAAIEMNTLFKLYSKKSAEEGGDGIDGWVTYSFSATPADATSDRTFPYYGGSKDGIFLHVTNYSGTTAPNCVEIQVVKMVNGEASPAAGSFFLDNAVNVPVTLSLKKAEGKYTLSFKKTEDGTLLKEVGGLELDESLFINEKGQTFFSTAIYEANGCDGNHWEHRGVAMFSAKVYTLDAASASVTLEKTEYVFEEGMTCKPAVTVKIGEKTLANNVDYYLEYKDNKAIGNASVVVKFMGEYAGNESKTAGFVIREKTPEQSSGESTSEGSVSANESKSEGAKDSSSGGCFGSFGGAAALSLFALAGVALLKKKRV